nr:unnamed protein product [Haemonchus contortus]
MHGPWIEPLIAFRLSQQHFPPHFFLCSQLDYWFRQECKQSYCGDEVDRLVSNMQTEMHVTRTQVPPSSATSSEFTNLNGIVAVIKQMLWKLIP